MDIGEIISWIVTIILAILGVSTLIIKKTKKSKNTFNNQKIKYGSGNIQARGNVTITKDVSNTNSENEGKDDK